MNPMVRHKVIRIDLGGDRREKHARKGCISLIGQGALALQNSPHGWRKRAFPSLPSSAPSLTHPHVFSFYLFSHLTPNPHTPSLRLPDYGPILGHRCLMVYGLSVSPPKSATPAVSVPCRFLLELLVGRYGTPSLGCLDAMNREFALSDHCWPLL